MQERHKSSAIPLTDFKIEGLGATNVLPNEVKLEGTFRTVNEEWRDEAHRRITQLAKGIAEGMGGSVEVDIRKGYPFLKNDETLTQECIESATVLLGDEHIEELDLWMAAEDFSYYSQVVPSCFYRLGTRNNEKGTGISVHNSAFDIDEDALVNGAGVFAYLAYRWLTN